MAGSQRPCVFCGQSSVKLSREHVFPEWLSIASGAKGFTMERNSKTVRTPLMEVVTRTVCEGCNNGWLSNIETVTKPVVETLLNSPDPYGMTPHDRWICARWLLKTLLACQLAATPRSESGPFIQEHYHLFYKRPEPVANQLTFLSAVGEPADHVIMEMHTPPEGSHAVSSYCFAFGRLLFWGFLTVLGEQFHVKAPAGIADATHILYPSYRGLFWTGDPTASLPWPPAVVLDQAVVEELRTTIRPDASGQLRPLNSTSEAQHPWALD